MTTAALTIREKVQAAGVRIQRVKRLDRSATVLITLGGVFIIVSVSFIFIFIFAQAVPLFRPAQGRELGVLKLAAPAAPQALGAAALATVPASTPPPIPAAAKPLVAGLDEYQRYLYQVMPDARIVFYRTADGSVTQEHAVKGLEGATVVSASRSLAGDYVALGTSDGRVALQQVRFRPRYEEQKLVDLDLEVRDRGLIEIDPAKRPVLEIAYHEREGRKAVAAQLAPDEIAVVVVGEDDSQTREFLKTKDAERITHVRLRRTEAVVASTERGELYHWELSPTIAFRDASKVSDKAITALEFGLGDGSLIVGDETGAVSAWFDARQEQDESRWGLVRAHVFEPQKAAVVAIGPSSRDKSFVTAGADGALVLRHLTSERKLLTFPGSGQPVESVFITPRSDAIYVRKADGQVAHYEIRNPHPEFSWRALFGKVWYEGYAKPDYVWQSTGATDDFEAKFSLVPLVFGTIKGTFYALLFAVPIAIMAALYTSQFVHPDIKARVKPLVEVMAALPSVVIGFLAGLWLASRVERDLVPVILMVAVLPLFGTLGVLFWDRLPHKLFRRLRAGMEIFVIVPLVLIGAWVAQRLGPGVESALFGGDLKMWLSNTMGVVYDQRNCLVVGIAMGFAIIPIIFTISEDAFSSVPSHLTAASLALGASRWQTATRVVLPTASPGIFSAVMIGFGRAVGETMIVLMATGNTPVLDWSIFNGMRTLSANIAVEIPEAPFGGTLYRILFLAGGVLFLMTFFVNTVAELIRQRLRERYRAI
jgi:phosphate transport system permease protein